MIRVYDSDEKIFANNGIKILHPLFAEITKEDNSDYYLEIEDTIENVDYYQKGMIIRTDTPWLKQSFRCDNPIIKNNRISCKAWHISYDSKNYIIKDAYSVDKNCNDALDYFNSATDIESPFTTVSDITKTLSSRMVARTLFEIYENFISDDMYGGHWYRDNWTLGIKQNIGQDRGVVLAYNKNIVDIEMSENWDNVCTKILPYTTDGTKRIYLDEYYLSINEKLYDIPYTKVVKFDNPYNTEDYKNYEEFLKDTIIWLKNTANQYLNENKLPKINYSVYSSLNDVSDVGDIIYIKHPKCKIDITTNVIKIKYDCIGNKYTSIEFGNFKKEIKNLSQQITGEIERAKEEVTSENKAFLEEELEEATSKINDMLGSSYKIIEEDKIMFVDKLPKEEATYVLKISNGGIGFSSTGINGTFTSAWALDGTLDMSTINVINLTASLIKGGTLKLGNLNNSSGTLEVYDKNGNIIGRLSNEGFIFTINSKEENIVDTLSTQNQKISEVTKTVEELNSKISDIADITISGESDYAFVELDNINISEPIRINIKPNSDDISYLYPNDNLYPSDTLYLKNRKIRFTNKTTEEIFDYELPSDLLFYDNDNYDEFILDYDAQSCVINKKVGINVDGSKYLLDAQTTIEYDYPKIELTDGDYKIELLGYSNAYIFVRLMAQNIYTTQFATRAEMNSKINQTSEEINLEVSKKVGEDEIISKINQTAEEVTINASKISLEGIITANGNVKITEDGSIEVNNGTFNGDIYLPSGGKVIGGDGILTNLQFASDTKFNELGFYSMMSDGANYRSQIVINADIPSNFTVTSAKLTLVHVPVKWHDGSSGASFWGRSQNIRVYKTSSVSNMYFELYAHSDGSFLNEESKYEIANAFLGGYFTASSASDNSHSAQTVETVDMSSYFTASGLHRITLQSADSIPNYTGVYSTDLQNTYQKTGYVFAILNILGYTSMN